MMFMTKRALITMLEDANNEVNRLNNEIDRLTGRLQAFDMFDKATPEDCVRGSWCHGCQFNRTVHIPARRLSADPIPVSFCDRGNLCNNFVQKDFVKEK